MPKKKTKIREAKTADEFREAVVERWHKVYSASSPAPKDDELLREQVVPRSSRRPLGASGGGLFGARLLGRGPMGDDDFDDE